MLFCTFLYCHWTTTDDGHVNTRQWLSFSFPKLWYSLLEFNSRRNCQHWANWTQDNKDGKVWSSATSLFQWRFRSRRCRCYLSSLSTKWTRQLTSNTVPLSPTLSLTHLKPLSPKSYQHQFSPNNTNIQSRKTVMRMDKMIIKGKKFWSFIKFS